MKAKVFGVLIAVLAISAVAVVPAVGAVESQETPPTPEAPAAVVPTVGASESQETVTTPEAPAAEGESAAATEPTTALAPQGCVELYVCAYSLENYEGTRYLFACSNYGEIGGAYMRSATNRCGNKANLLKIGGSILACMNPGGNRPNPGLFTSVFILASGSRC